MTSSELKTVCHYLPVSEWKSQAPWGPCLGPWSIPVDVCWWLNPLSASPQALTPSEPQLCCHWTWTSLSSSLPLHAHNSRWQALSHPLTYFYRYVSRVKHDSGSLSPRGMHPAVSSLHSAAPHHLWRTTGEALALSLLLPSLALKCLALFFPHFS